MSVSQVTPQATPLFDMSKAQPIGATAQPSAAPGKPLFDMSKAKPIAATSAAPSTPSTLTDTSPMADPGSGKPYQEPETTGPLHQVGGFLQGVGENVSGAIKGVHDLFQEPQNDDERAIQQKLMSGDHGELGGRLALAGHRFLSGVNDTMNQMDTAGKKGAQEAKESGSTKAGILTDMENEPFIGSATKLAEQGEYGKALGDLLTTVLSMRGLPDRLKPGAKVAVPATTSEPIAGAPLTSGEAAGPGLRQGAEKLFSKTSTAENRMGDVMANRTAAIQNAAEKVAPAAPSPEDVGASLQGASRDVLDRQQQAQTLTKDLADRAQERADAARAAATDQAGNIAQRGAQAEISNAQAVTEQAGTAAQDAATQKLNARRTASVDAGKATAKSLSGVDEMPVPETDREIIGALRGANADAKIEESAAHNQLAENAKAKNITVDTAPMQKVAQEVVSLEGPAQDLVMSSLPASVYRTLQKVAGPPTYESDIIASRAKDFGWDAGNLTDDQLAHVKKDIADNPHVSTDPERTGPVEYQTMKTARTAVGEALQAARKHFQQTGMGNNAVRTLQSLYGSMTDAMRESVAGDAQLSDQFEKANALTRERASTFVDPKSVRKLVYADDPGKVMGSVMRSGSDSDVSALKTALDADKTGQGLARAQRGAMDYILRKSSKAATSDLPAGVNPEAIDYDLATRNAKSSTALRTLLGDDKYAQFVDDLDKKRLAQRAPDEINLDNQLTKIAKADSPEKAAKLAGVTVEPSDQAVRLSKAGSPEQAAKIAGYDAGTDPEVQTAERQAANAKGVSDRLRTPTAAERGPQRVAESLASDLEPSKIVSKAAGSPEYTDHLLSVLDKHPDAVKLRQTLGQRIFRDASDGAMVRGAFGSTDGIFDVEKFQKAYADARPSLAKILPYDDLAGMDEFNTALNKYALSKGIGGGAGMSGRFMAMRQIFGVLSMARGVLAASPSSFALGAAASFGPRVWMEIATRPALARAVTKVLSEGAGGARKLGAAGEIQKQSQVPEGRIPVTTPAGDFHFPDQESANQFKQAAGIQ